MGISLFQTFICLSYSPIFLRQAGTWSCTSAVILARLETGQSEAIVPAGQQVSKSNRPKTVKKDTSERHVMSSGQIRWYHYAEIRRFEIT
jgi:hypothetical protein